MCSLLLFFFVVTSRFNGEKNPFCWGLDSSDFFPNRGSGGLNVLTLEVLKTGKYGNQYLL